MNLRVMLLVLTSVSLSALAQVVLRKGMLTACALPILGRPIALVLDLLTNGWLWAGVIAYGVSFGLWLAVLSRVPVSAAYPMISIGFVIVALLGSAFLGETLTPTRVVGIAFICCGVLLVSRSA